ncbi:MAG: hypothetical protein ABFC24_11785 [Methanoregulaceae archaeon]
MTKRLLLIPIIHSEKEMGSLKSDISDLIDRKFGKEKRDQHRRDVALFWETLRSIIAAVLNNVEGSTIRIYQDGIPIGGETGVRLIRMGADDGIPNNQILVSIIEHGGVLEKTESPTLLKEEYGIIKAIVNAGTDQEREALSEKFKRRLYDLTIERDQYIAKRIGESLGEGMLGLLFIGATHDVARYLPADIEVSVCNFIENDVLAWVNSGKNKNTSAGVEEVQ